MDEPDFIKNFESASGASEGMSVLANGAATFYKTLRSNGLSEDVSALIVGTYVGILFHEYYDMFGDNSG